MPPSTNIDPATGARFALQGRIVTMNRARTVIPDGTLYIDKGSIVAISGHPDQPPAGFEKVKIVRTAGTIYPGLIELHNHLSYNALPLWQVPGQYDNRNQWGSRGEPVLYRKLVSGPMKILGRNAYLPSIIRFVEVKSLVAGTTTSQGIELYSNKSSRRYYRGLVRNVECTNDSNLPHAATRIADVELRDVLKFKKRLDSVKGALILHLSEGTDEKTNRHFKNLQLPGGEWALNDKLIGIHCVALTREDFAVMAAHGAKMVWSPLSNLLLYGKTANVSAALDENVTVCLGSDWSVSGSKNLLGELKVAHLVAPAIKPVDLLAMATSNAAAAVGWDGSLGSLELHKKADLFVIPGVAKDPYEQLLHAGDDDISLVMINGVPRFGTPRTMKSLGITEGEPLSIKRRSKLLYLDQNTADPDVGALSYHDAITRLDDAMANIRDIAREPDAAPNQNEETWSLALEEDDDAIRLPGREEEPPLPDAAPSQPLWKILEPMKRDLLTAVEDTSFFNSIKRQVNLIDEVKKRLKSLYQ